jgi:hypothetical protein
MELMGKIQFLVHLQPLAVEVVVDTMVKPVATGVLVEVLVKHLEAVVN